MQVIKKELDIKTDREVTIIPLSDLHVGNIGCDTKKIKETISWIKDRGAYTILLGDMIDAITQKDPRHENDSIHPDFMDKLDNLAHEQTMAVYKLLEPISDRIIATMQGNHELAVKKHFSYDSGSVLAQMLNVPKVPDPSFVRLRLRRTKTAVLTYDIWCSHGVGLGGGRMKGGKVNNMLKISNGFKADAYMCGHTHDLFTVNDTYAFPNQIGKVEQRKRVFINTGSFQKTHDLPDDVDTWASRSGFMPARTGVARLDVYLKPVGNSYKLAAYARC